MIWATAGGVTVGLAILIHFVIAWYPGKKPLLKRPLDHVGRLLPFVFGWAYGALGTLTVMGLIGWAFDTALWAANWLGDAVLWLGVGESPGQISHGAVQPLTAVGNFTVVLLTAAVIALIKYRPSGSEIKKGVLSGLCLGTSAGVAGLTAVPLANAVNALGTVVYGNV